MTKRACCVYLYEEPQAPTLNILEISSYIKTLLPEIGVEVRNSFINFHLASLSQEERQRRVNYLAERFATAKVRDLLSLHKKQLPLPGEVNYERRRLSSEVSRSFGLLYDAIEVMNILRELTPQTERNLNHIHIVFTNQLFGTWDEADRKYHARVILCGFPSLISTTGIVEAPAKPKEFYLLKKHYLSLGIQDLERKDIYSQFKGKFIDYNDPRLTEVMKGYVMQALFYHLTGEPFCEDKNCRLYNSHWQEEVIQSQLESPYEFCPYHQQEIQKLRGKITAKAYS